MRSKEITKLFITLFFGITFVLSFSHYGAVTFERVFKQSDIFEEGTIVGSVDVSGLNHEQATESIMNSLNTWFQASNLTINYKEVVKKIDSELFRFSIQESVEAAKNKQVSPLIMTIQESVYKELIDSLQDEKLVEGINHSLLKQDLSNVVTTMKQGDFAFKLIDYLERELETVVVTTGNAVLTEEQAILFTEIFDGKNQFIIPALSEFSLLDYLENQSIQLTSENVSVIASALYKTVLPTNFEITERHTSRHLPDYIELGYEAKVKEPSMDLSFYNPNGMEYVVNMMIQDQELRLELVGTPFLYQYEIELRDKQTFQPKSILQFDSNLSFGEIKILEEGKEGFIITVIRNKLESNGNILNYDKVSEDFYPPVHQVILSSVLPKDLTSEEDGTEKNVENREEEQTVDQESVE